MIIVLTICLLTVIVLILYLLKNKQKLPAQGTKSVKKESPTHQNRTVSLQHKEQHNESGVNRESIQRGLKSILSAAQFDFSNEPLPLKRADVPQELHKRVRDCVGDMREFS